MYYYWAHNVCNIHSHVNRRDLDPIPLSKAVLFGIAPCMVMTQHLSQVEVRTQTRPLHKVYFILFMPFYWFASDHGPVASSVFCWASIGRICSLDKLGSSFFVFQ